MATSAEKKALIAWRQRGYKDGISNKDEFPPVEHGEVAVAHYRRSYKSGREELERRRAS